MLSDYQIRRMLIAIPVVAVSMFFAFKGDGCERRRGLRSQPAEVSDDAMTNALAALCMRVRSSRSWPTSWEEVGQGMDTDERAQARLEVEWDLTRDDYRLASQSYRERGDGVGASTLRFTRFADAVERTPELIAYETQMNVLLANCLRNARIQWD